MNMGLTVFFSVIVILVIAGACALTVFLEREFPSEKYDERQKLARGNAYRFSFLISVVYYLVLMIVFLMNNGKLEWTVQPFAWVFIGILIQLQSFHIYCLMTHCALPLGSKPIPAILCYFLMGGVYLAQYFLQYIPGDVVGFTGAYSFNLFRLLVALDFFSLAVLHLIAFLRKEKE